MPVFGGGFRFVNFFFFLRSAAVRLLTKGKAYLKNFFERFFKPLLISAGRLNLFNYFFGLRYK